MTPELILATIKSIADSITAIFTWLITPPGVQFSTQLAQDRQAWDRFWADAGKGIERLFKGELFK